MGGHHSTEAEGGGGVTSRRGSARSATTEVGAGSDAAPAPAPPSMVPVEKLMKVRAKGKDATQVTAVCLRTSVVTFVQHVVF